MPVTSLAVNYFVDFYYSLCINLHRRAFVCCVIMYVLLILWTRLMVESCGSSCVMRVVCCSSNALLIESNSFIAAMFVYKTQ